MTLSWQEHDEAHEELRAAANWYEAQREGMGQRFIDAVETAVVSVLDPSITWGFYSDISRLPKVHSRGVAGVA